MARIDEFGGYTSDVVIQRAANVTPYTAGDVLGGLITLPGLVPSSQEQVIINSVMLLLNITALPTGIGTQTLCLYNSTPSTILNDNDPWLLPPADINSFVGEIALGTPTLAFGAGSIVYLMTENLSIQRRAIGNSFFAYLRQGAGFTPAANSETGRLVVRSRRVL